MTTLKSIAGNKSVSGYGTVRDIRRYGLIPVQCPSCGMATERITASDDMDYEIWHSCECGWMG